MELDPNKTFELSKDNVVKNEYRDYFFKKEIVKVIYLLDELDELDAAEAFFDFRVADIAMGSGHFLVAAVDRIEARFSGYLANRHLPRITQELGRLKVRAYSIHSEDNSLVPTDDLPWAMVVQPITSAAISGIGRSPTGIVEGTWVYGVFMDEGEFQQPLVIGTLVGKPYILSSSPEALCQK